MSENLMIKMRDSRKNWSVLKVKIMQIRSADKGSWIFVYEGPNDVGVYEEWVNSLSWRQQFRPLPGVGKDQVLSLCRNLETNAEYASKILYFVDKDFDGLKGMSPQPNLFCTDTYSVENYVVNEGAIRSILNDEFRCAATGCSVEIAIGEFNKLYEQFLTVMHEVNLRIFFAKVLKIKVSSIEESIGKYVDIALTGVKSKVTSAELNKLVPLDCDSEPSISDEIKAVFCKCRPQKDFRGKFAHSFLKAWFDCLYEDRRAKIPQLFTLSQNAMGFSQATLSLRSLASRTPIPSDLSTFLRTHFVGTHVV
jgi:Protein of unknown function (DUF4435)